MYQYDELREVCRQFGWNPVQIRGDRGLWKVTLPDRKMALKQSRAPFEKLILLHQILSDMKQNGFAHSLPFALTAGKNPVVRTGTSCWYALPWKEKQKREITAREIVSGLARLHRLSEPVINQYPELINKTDERLLKEWKSKQEQLQFYEDERNGREFPSPFDQSFAQVRERMDRSLSFAIRGMSRFLETEEGMAPRYVLCHRRIHPGNVVWDEQNLYFIDFDHAQADSPVRDLALAVHRFGDVTDPENSPAGLIQTYEEILPLQPKEKRLLALYLSYPERLLKILSQYYHHPKLSGESQAVSRLERESILFEEIQGIVRRLWPARKKDATKQKNT
ncbi:phosphotransferase [Thermoactinomyces mirandus]|uniref:Phosphotransferase n=1 Tax=Thermoactinomyces mirandus TaxID=2756294 RepID=A0A7W1XSX4_9BACL|nr:phosphotransferase [Thermoactinomyces mirandus]MBA4602703.1 phosphotransferase [Thermoactinomyces mirandus]